MKKRIYMAVEADEYEYPICVEDSALALAVKLAVTEQAIKNCASKNRYQKKKIYGINLPSERCGSRGGKRYNRVRIYSVLIDSEACVYG